MIVLIVEDRFFFVGTMYVNDTRVKLAFKTDG
jgi:hypothetical protein